MHSLQTGRALAAAAVGALVAGLAACAASAATLSPGKDPGLLSAYTVGARYRAQSSGDEHYAGINDLGSTLRNEAGYDWSPGTIPFDFAYDSATGLITSVLDGTNTVTFAADPGLVSDALRLTLANRSKETAVLEITDLAVNGESLPDLTCTGWCDFMVSDFAILPTLSVTGNIQFSGVMSANESERTKFEIASSTAPLPAVPLPAPAVLLVAGLAALGWLRGRRGA